ncbi:PREDICTED: uncharacterized protein LOC109585427 [Amphimedon queenslandica]|uniref:Uncharacterized protein n=1 Tax=Amphimedon queenslandica TaxID=400682 RepID=A0AAN0JJW5_AMPQE|nr:PREDICTED: uncharacterized protein LOC109585427 [Amphimedon queenslandica]|eukprot:XP_019857062.1 PREDICTED: uncharacterized protein LOC109585427 [Amphimedon queenslandica]
MVKGAGILILLLCASYVIGEGTKDDNNIEQQDSHTKDDESDSFTDDNVSSFEEDNNDIEEDEVPDEEENDHGLMNEESDEGENQASCTYKWVKYRRFTAIPVYSYIRYRKCIKTRSSYNCKYTINGRRIRCRGQRCSYKKCYKYTCKYKYYRRKYLSGYTYKTVMRRKAVSTVQGKKYGIKFNIIHEKRKKN